MEWTSSPAARVTTIFGFYADSEYGTDSGVGAGNRDRSSRTSTSAGRRHRHRRHRRSRFHRPSRVLGVNQVRYFHSGGDTIVQQAMAIGPALDHSSISPQNVGLGLARARRHRSTCGYADFRPCTASNRCSENELRPPPGTASGNGVAARDARGSVARAAGRRRLTGAAHGVGAPTAQLAAERAAAGLALVDAQGRAGWSMVPRRFPRAGRPAEALSDRPGRTPPACARARCARQISSDADAAVAMTIERTGTINLRDADFDL